MQDVLLFQPKLTKYLFNTSKSQLFSKNNIGGSPEKNDKLTSLWSDASIVTGGNYGGMNIFIDYVSLNLRLTAP